MSRLWRLGAVAALLGLASGEAYTPKHEAGRCSIRGSCGSSGFFSPALPCPDNGLAREPDDDVRKQLVDLCGPKWSSGPVCCEADQVCLVYDLVSMHLLTSCSLIHCHQTSRQRITSYQRARPARRTSIISSAPSLALLTSLYSSMSPRSKRVAINQE